MNMAAPYIMRCAACGARNRIPRQRAGGTAKCGKCKGSLDTREILAATPVVVSDRDFEEKILRSPLPTLLDCWAPWCGPCQSMAPVMTELAAEWKGRVRVGKLNVDQNPMVASRFQVMSVPTLLIFDGGQLRETIPGAAPKPAILQRMAPYIQ